MAKRFDFVGRLYGCLFALLLTLALAGCESGTALPTAVNATPFDFSIPVVVNDSPTVTMTAEASSAAAEAATLTPTETSSQDFRTRPVSGIVTPASPLINGDATLASFSGVPSNVKAWDRYVLRHVDLIIPVPPGWIIREWPLPDAYPIYYSVSVIPSYYANSQAVLLPEISLTVYRDPLSESLENWFIAHSSIAAFDRNETVDPNVFFYEVTQARQVRVGEVPALRFTRNVLNTNVITVLMANGETVATISAVVYSLADLKQVYEVMLTGIEFAD